MTLLKLKDIPRIDEDGAFEEVQALAAVDKVMGEQTGQVALIEAETEDAVNALQAEMDGARDGEEDEVVELEAA